MKQWLLLPALMFLSISSALSQDGRASIAKSYIENQIRQNSQGRAKLISFQKTNGVERNLGGMTMYSLEYRIVVETPGEGWLKIRDFSIKDKQPYENGSVAWSVEGSVEECITGKRIQIDGAVMMEKSDNGWRCVGPVENKQRQVLNSPTKATDGKEYAKYLGVWKATTVSMTITKDGNSYKVVLGFEDGENEFTVTPKEGKLYCKSSETGDNLIVSYNQITHCLKGYMNWDFCKTKK